MNEDLNRLRKRFDSNDPFLAGGHQIKKIRAHERRTPEWANNDVGIQNIIQSAFPNWRTNALQRKRAARWVRVIYLFYRVGASRTTVAKEMKIEPEIVKEILKHIRRVAKGTRADNAGPRRRSMTPSAHLL